MTRLWPQGEKIKTWGEEETPSGFVWQRSSHQVVDVCNRWRIHTRWWESGAAIWREYVKATTDTGLLCLIYRDLSSGDWFLARVYD